MNRACLPSLCSWAAALALATAPAWGQVQITSSPNPVGSGARALGMGGAFVAIADDATAASWNPGGLTQLERPEVSLVFNQKFFSEDFNSGTQYGLETDNDVSISDVNYFSGVYPIKHTIAGRNLVLSLNFQKKFDFDRQLSGKFVKLGAFAPGTISRVVDNFEYKQEGQLNALSPAFGIEVTDKLSVGAAVNIWDSSIVPGNGWSTTQLDRTTQGNKKILFGATRTETDYDKFRGINFTIGTLYKPNPRWSLGLVYNTKFTADVEFRRRTRTWVGAAAPGHATERRGIEYVFPSSVALGAAYRFPNDKLTLSFDITRREWDQFVINDPKNPTHFLRRRQGVSDLPLGFAPELDPTYTVRLGMEYVFVNPSKPRQDYLPSLRAGVFYDPEPSSGPQSTFWGWGINKFTGKVEDYYGFSLGTGVLIKNRVNIDFAYTLRFGKGVREDTYQVPETDADVTQHLFYLSTVIYF